MSVRHWICLPVLTTLTCLVVIIATKELVYYADLEHLQVPYWNSKYYAFMKYSARRYSRRDPIHYLTAHFESLVVLGNNLSVSAFVYQFLSNEYRRSFVELHYKMCDLVIKDKIVGQFIRLQLPDKFKVCPFPKGVYFVANMSIPDMPLLSTFPFQKGRLFMNFTLTHPNGTRERMVDAYVDAQIKTKWRM